MNTVLILEDSVDLLDSLSMTISGLGCTVHTAMTLSRAYLLLEKYTFDLVLLDRELPDGDSLELAEYVHQENFQTKILFLSHHADLNEKIIGLEKGADEYLPKPFSQSELILRIRILLHRSKIHTSQIITAGPILLNPTTGELFLKDQMKRLRKKENQILTCLMRHKNALVSRETIVSHVWSRHDQLPTQTTLDVYIRRIRIILQEHKDLLQTVRGYGYTFVV